MVGITINGTHTYTGFQMLMLPYTIGAPEPYIRLVNVPGRDGPVDMSGALPKMHDRLLEFRFRMYGEYIQGRYRHFSNDYNGQSCTITIDGDDDYYYDGRCTVGPLEPKNDIAEFDVQFLCRPYKTHKTTGVKSL